MADDLVAELTLRIRNEMESGFDEMKSEFSGLKDSILGLNGTLGETNELLQSLRAPIALDDGFKGAATSAEGMITAIEGIEPASAGAVGAIEAIGAAIDEDAAKMQALLADMYQAQDEMHQGASGGGGYVTPPGGADDKPETPDDESPEEGRSKSGHSKAGHFSNPILDIVALGSGYQGAEYDAQLQTVLSNITNTEKIHGVAAQQEQIHIGDMMHHLALKYSADSHDLLLAYNYLITTGIKPQEVDALMPGLAEASTAHGISVSDMQGAVMALNESFKISPDQMGTVLGQLGYATKMGHFNAESFGAFLPRIGGALSAIGVSGPDSADYTFAALESIIKNVSIPSEAATDYTDFIHYIGTQHAERTFLQKSRMMLPQMRAIFSKYHINETDLWGMENQAQAEGKDPVQTILDYVHNATKSMSPADRNAVISDWFTNQQGGDAVRALMQYWNGSTGPSGQYEPGFQDNYKTLQGINQQTLDQDFASAVAGATGTMKRFDENLRELNETLGRMFQAAAKVTSAVVTDDPMPSSSPAYNRFGVPGTSKRVDQGNVLAGMH